MKWLSIFLSVLLVVGFLAYRTHVEQKRTEAERLADAETAAERDAQSKRREEERRLREAQEARPVMAISKLLEPWVLNVTANMDVKNPEDLVPPLELLKQRVLDKKGRAESERKPMFDQAASLFDALIALAEERTKALEEMLRNEAKGVRTLDQPDARNHTSEFFNRSVQQRWDQLVARYKPAVQQRMDQLRQAERAWNATLSQNAFEETYERPSVDPVLITVEPAATSKDNFGSTSSNNGRQTRPWRRIYYDQNGYRYTR